MSAPPRYIVRPVRYVAGDWTEECAPEDASVFGLYELMPDGTRQWRADFCERALAVQSAAAPDLLAALRAIRARLAGDWDNAALLAFGSLGAETTDVDDIARAAIAKAQP